MKPVPATFFELVVESQYHAGTKEVVLRGTRAEVANAYITAMEKTIDGDVDLAILKDGTEYVSWDTPMLENWSKRKCALFIGLSD